MHRRGHAMPRGHRSHRSEAGTRPEEGGYRWRAGVPCSLREPNSAFSQIVFQSLQCEAGSALRKRTAGAVPVRAGAGSPLPGSSGRRCARSRWPQLGSLAPASWAFGRTPMASPVVPRSTDPLQAQRTVLTTVEEGRGWPAEQALWRAHDGAGLFPPYLSSQSHITKLYQVGNSYL